MKNVAGKNYRILERKSSRFGAVGTVDRGSELGLGFTVFDRQMRRVSLKYYNNLKRKDIYRTALDKYLHDELARPIVNLIVYAIFREPPDFQGDEDQVKTAQKIIKDSNVDWTTWGRDLEIHGDVFLRAFFGKNPLIASIPAQSIDIAYDENNVLKITKFVQDLHDITSRSISPDRMCHIKINGTTNMVYGSSTLRPVFWWLDVLDNLWERNWIRAAQYYGAPIVSITGVPGEHQGSVKTSLEADGQRPGKNWLFPEGVKAETLDFTRNYPIETLIDRVYQYIVSACNIPQHLIYESSSSRGVAMFSGDGFEMMIKARRRTWSLGLLQCLKSIFVKDGGKPEDFDLKLRWAPVFARDLKALAQLIDTGMVHKLYSRKSAREKLMLDHSVEVANLKKEKKEEPEDVKVPIVPAQVEA